MARLLSLLLPTAMGLYANFQGLQQILVPMQVEAIDPQGKIGNMALVTMICAVTGVVGLTMGGAGSDATRGRWGRRAPWLVAMAILSALLTMGLGFQRGLVGVSVLCGALWFSLNCFQGALLAVAPDRVPDSRRSLASSVFAIAGPIGAVVGVGIAAMAPSIAGNAALAVLLLATTAAFVLFAREAPWPHARRPEEVKLPGSRPRFSWGLFRSFSSPDFSLAYAFRLLMFIAQFSITNFLFYILQDRIGVANLPSGNAQIAAGELNSLRTAATVVAIVLGSALAHRTERRKIFPQAYAVLMAAAMLVPVLSPTWIGMLVYGVLGGVAMGLYAAIDLTLMSRLLPSRDSAGRDLALLVMAGASAQFVAPVVGGVLIKFMGYNALFLFAAIGTLAAGAVTFFIKGVR
jgi:MFS family permease